MNYHQAALYLIKRFMTEQGDDKIEIREMPSSSGLYHFLVYKIGRWPARTEATMPTEKLLQPANLTEDELDTMVDLLGMEHAWHLVFGGKDGEPF